MAFLLFVTLLCQCLSTGLSSTYISKEDGQEMHRSGFPLMIKALEKRKHLCPQCNGDDDFVKSSLKKIYDNFRENYTTVVSSVNADLSSVPKAYEALCNKNENIDDCEKDIVKSYTKETLLYKDANSALRKQKQGYEPDINDVKLGTYVMVLDSILRYGKQLKRCPKDITYRGLNLPESDLNLYKVETSFCWLAFTSTSMNVNKAKQFLNVNGNGVLFTITSLNIEGWQPRDITEISIFANEEECLYPAGTMFKVRDIKQANGYTNIKLDSVSGDISVGSGWFITGGLHKLKMTLIVHFVMVLTNL